MDEQHNRIRACLISSRSYNCLKSNNDCYFVNEPLGKKLQFLQLKLDISNDGWYHIKVRN